MDVLLILWTFHLFIITMYFISWLILQLWYLPSFIICYQIHANNLSIWFVIEYDCWIWVCWQQWMGICGVNLCVCKWNIFHNGLAPLSVKTRTIRTHAFWGYPPLPNDYPYYWVVLDPKSKEDKVKGAHLNNLPKFQIWNGSTEYWWRYRADTILSTDGQTEKVNLVYPVYNFVEAAGIMKGSLNNKSALV